MSEFRPIKNFLNRWLGPLEASRKPAQIPQRAQLQLVHPNTPADKTANVRSVKTYGTGKEGPELYGAIPISKERAQQIAQETQAEALKHEKEIAPIKSYNQGRTEFGATMGGLGITDPKIIRDIQQWDAKQRALLEPLKIREIPSTSPIRTFHN